MALVLTIGGVNRTSVLVKGSLTVEHRAEGFISVCSLTLSDANNNIAIAAEDTITVIDDVITFFAGRVVTVDYVPFTTAHRNILLTCQDKNAQLNEVVVDDEEVFTAEADAGIIDALFDEYLPAVDSETYVATIQDPLTITLGPCSLRSALSQICTRTGGYYYIDFNNKLHYFSAEADVCAWWLSNDPDQVDSFSYFDVVKKVSNATTRLDGVFVLGDGVQGWRGTHGAGDRCALVRDNRITTTTGINQRGDALLAEHGNAKVTYTVSTYKAGLEAGMDVRFICAIYGVDDTFTVRRMTVKWDVSQMAYYELELGDPVNPSLVGERLWLDTIGQAMGPISAPRLPTSSKGWGHDLVFSATDHNTVAWAAGDITLADGTVYNIVAGNTGNIAAITYIYLDIDTSTTVLQTATVSSSAVGSKKILVAWAQPQAVGLEATFIVFGGAGQGVLVDTTNIAVGAVHTDQLADLAVELGKIADGAVDADKIAANAVTATKILAGSVTTTKLAAGAVTANEIAADAVTSAKILAGTIEAGDIKSNTITTLQMAAGAITTNEIAANTILAGNIDSGAVTTDELAAGAVTTDKINAGAVIATKVDIGGFGDLLFTEETGLLLLNPHSRITPTSWSDTRGNNVGLSGAFHQEAGPWVDSRGLVVEPATTNYELAPRMKDANSDGLADGWGYEENVTGAETTTVVSHPIAERGWMQRIQYTGAVGDTNKYIQMWDFTPDSSFAPGNACTLSLDVKGVTTGTTITIRISALPNGSTGAIGIVEDTVTLAPGIQRVSLIYPSLPASTQRVRVLIKISSIDNGDTITIYFGAVNLEKALFATSFCCGALDWCAWSGAEDDSTSTRTATVINLDAHVGLISNQDQLTFSMWVQAPYDYDATWPTGYCWVFDTRGWNDNNRILICYNSTADRFQLFVNGDYRILTTGITFEAGDWLCLDATVNFTDNVCKLYINGEQVGISGVSHTSAPVLTTWKLGSSWGGTYQSGWCIGEYAVLGTVWPAEEVAAQYALHRPLVDAGATEKPGLYILDGRVKIASSTTGNRIEITADGIAGYDGGGTKQFYLRASDGAGVFGGGAGILDANGQRFIGTGATGDARSIRFRYLDDATERTMGNIYGDWGGSGDCGQWMIAWRRTGAPWTGAQAIVAAVDQISSKDVRLTVASGGIVSVSGSTKFTTNAAIEAGSYIEAQGDIRTVAGIRAGNIGAVDDGDIWCSGYISTDGGVTKWELGGYVAGAPVAEGYLNVWIGAQRYKVLVDRV